ncbi:hypothetical protein L7F22_043297 [Adiantum nelumboides]|nr:hypothetical protein [Adiantum nelumboides]
MELMHGGSLDKCLHDLSNGDECLNWQQRLDIALGVAQGLVYLHHEYDHTCVVHCDLKPSNILLDGDMQPHIADFGLAKILLPTADKRDPDAINNSAVSAILQEYACSSNPTTKGDVFSYGIILMELVTGKRPTSTELWEGMTIQAWAAQRVLQNLQNVIDSNLLRTTEHLDEESKKEIYEQIEIVIQMGLKCACESPYERLSMKQVFFLSINHNQPTFGGDGANNIEYGLESDKNSNAFEEEMPSKVEQYLVQCDAMEDQDLKGNFDLMEKVESVSSLEEESEEKEEIIGGGDHSLP